MQQEVKKKYASQVANVLQDVSNMLEEVLNYENSSYDC